MSDLQNTYITIDLTREAWKTIFRCDRSHVCVTAVGGFNQRTSSEQANPNKSKQKSLDLLGFIRKSVLFNELRWKKMKKFSPARLASRVVHETSQSALFS
jgi:hypothetical protein